MDTSQGQSGTNENTGRVPTPGWTVLPAGVELEVFYDGDCPLCLREITMLSRLDKKKLLQFTDIAAPDFKPEPYGRTFDALMAEIHGRLPNGRWITGVEVFRRLYSAIGFGWIVALTRIPGISHGLDWGYWVFARNRLKLTGRCTSACDISTTSRFKEKGVS